jgi:hypothetical protein
VPAVWTTLSYRPAAHRSKASSIRMTRTFRLDLPLCREVSNCSSLQPSGLFSSTSRRLSVFDKLQDFFPKHSYRKIAAAVRTTWIPVWTRSSMRQVSQFKSKCSDERASDMEIACIKSTVQTIIPTVRTREVFILKLLIVNVRPFGRQGTAIRTQLKNMKEF